MSASNTPENFWSRVVQPEEGCWEWLGAVNNRGYGCVGWRGKVVLAHRLAAFLWGLVAQIEAPPHGSDKFVLHRCDNRRCCREDHLYLGTYSRNMLDAYERGRKMQPRSAHVNAKLTYEQVLEIRRVYRVGSGPAFAAVYGVSETTVLNAACGRTYADVV